MPKKIETIQHQIERCEESLSKVQEKERRIISNQGWGYGMRHARIGVSTSKSDRLKSRLAGLKEELRLAIQNS